MIPDNPKVLSDGDIIDAMAAEISALEKENELLRRQTQGTLKGAPMPKFTLTAECNDRTVTTTFEAELYSDILEAVADWLAGAGFTKHQLDIKEPEPPTN
jgi:hypothetical protein